MNNLPKLTLACDGTYASSMLVVNDFQTRGVPSGAGMVNRARLTTVLAGLDVDYDVYDVVGTDWHNCYDGIGRREDRPTQQPRPPHNGATNQMLHGYDCSIWYAGGLLESDVMLSDLRTLSLSGGHPSCDQQKLETWSAGCTSGDNRLLVLEGLGMEAAAREQRLAAANEKMFESFFRTQVLWDESMASRIVDYLRSPAGEGKKMVVVAGGFHVRHGLGVPRRVLRRAAWPQVIVLPEEISIPEELREELTMDVDPPEIPLIAGDFAWMVAYEDIEKKRVRLGVVLRVQEKTVLVDKVLTGSAAEAAGIQPGDAFVSIDDLPIAEQGDVILVIGTKKAGL